MGYRNNNNTDRFSLVVHAINVNSIVRIPRRHNLSGHINLYKPDVVLLSETGLNKVHKIQFCNYTFIRSDKSSGNRGTGILIKSKFVHKIVQLPINHSFEIQQ